ncbi:hypothetical protein HPP92_005515 [Vanilla planifolia]|uniref:Uncharacterized protein n=1 Tax=Vanilla planifolia TaxID=51239 RepID=A0A835RTQ0_VANPL|nr:hypothetical protein HPP92_005515 [Vanilla planifolia]
MDSMPFGIPINLGTQRRIIGVQFLGEGPKKSSPFFHKETEIGPDHSIEGTDAHATRFTRRDAKLRSTLEYGDHRQETCSRNPKPEYKGKWLEEL